jgi:hypothetical protein
LGGWQGENSLAYIIWFDPRIGKKSPRSLCLFSELPSPRCAKAQACGGIIPQNAFLRKQIAGKNLRASRTGEEKHAIAAKKPSEFHDFWAIQSIDLTIRRANDLLKGFLELCAGRTVACAQAAHLLFRVAVFEA